MSTSASMLTSHSIVARSSAFISTPLAFGAGGLTAAMTIASTASARSQRPIHTGERSRALIKAFLLRAPLLRWRSSELLDRGRALERAFREMLSRANDEGRARG